jgi:hypothetical protein
MLDGVVPRQEATKQNSLLGAYLTHFGMCSSVTVCQCTPSRYENMAAQLRLPLFEKVKEPTNCTCESLGLSQL